jgi:hypothetical protein
MKTFIVISLISLSFILGGCSENSVPVSSADSQATLSKVPVPFKIVVDGITTVNPATWAVSFEATFVGSHLGKGTATGTTYLQFTSPTAGNLINGDFILTAANGDQLNLIGTGTFIINGLITNYVMNSWTIESGTGRFADVTGSIQGFGVGTLIDPANPLVKTVHLEGQGSIQY